jgi:hypothetical protein
MQAPRASLFASTVPPVALELGARQSRVAYLDNLKVALVAGVIMGHAAGFYLGGGYGFVQPGMSYSAAAVLWIAFGFGTMFAMGTFFFMAGSLTPASLTRKGPRTYLGDRLLPGRAPGRIDLAHLADLLVWRHAGCVGRSR